jgi:hypothetical protein
MTVKQAAQLMNVSERLVYMAIALRRSGRQDLIESVERGELSINAALKIANGKPSANLQKDTYAALVRAWNRATEDEQGRFLVAVGWRDAP